MEGLGIRDDVDLQNGDLDVNLSTIVQFLLQLVILVLDPGCTLLV